jgi:hypothetical protein
VEAERAARVTLDLTHRQLDVGYVNYLTLLNAETTYQQVLLSLVQAQATRFGDTAALFQALGGGWWNRVDVASSGESGKAAVVADASPARAPAIEDRSAEGAHRGWFAALTETLGFARDAAQSR